LLEITNERGEKAALLLYLLAFYITSLPSIDQ